MVASRTAPSRKQASPRRKPATTRATLKTREQLKSFAADTRKEIGLDTFKEIPGDHTIKEFIHDTFKEPIKDHDTFKEPTKDWKEQKEFKEPIFDPPYGGKTMVEGGPPVAGLPFAMATPHQAQAADAADPNAEVEWIRAQLSALAETKAALESRLRELQGGGRRTTRSRR